MTDLERILNRISELDDEIGVRQREKDELETAVRVIRRLAGAIEQAPNRRSDSEVRISQRNGDTKGTIKEMAQRILADGSARYYATIADAAISQGYQGKRGSSPERIRKSFWAIMKRDPETFDAVGGGRFKLRTEGSQ